jgi:hypothetical protein
MPIETRFDDLDLREEPAAPDAERSPLLGSSNATAACGTKVCCTCPPPFA